MSFSDPRPLRDRLVAAAPTLLVQAAVGYALLSGLAVTVFHDPERTLTTSNIPVEPLPPVEQPTPEPLPRAERATPRPEVFRPVPEVFTEATPTTSLSSEPPVLDLGSAPVLLPEPTPEPAISLARAAAPRGNQGDWFPRDAYPAAARRSGAQGRVSVSVDVGAGGRVTACRVTASSGNEELDGATCRLATRNGRFAPALDESGRPVAATYPLRNVRWVLEE